MISHAVQICVSTLCRSCERSLRSLDQESPPKKKKLQPTYTSTTHLLPGKKCPSSLQTKSNDMETTVFYIPGVDVKVSVLVSLKSLQLVLCFLTFLLLLRLAHKSNLTLLFPKNVSYFFSNLFNK